MISWVRIHSIYTSDLKRLITYFEYAISTSGNLKREERFVFHYEEKLEFSLLAVTSKKNTRKIITALKKGETDLLQQIVRELEQFVEITTHFKN